VHCAGGWVSSRAGLDGCGKCHPHWDLIPGMSSLKQITIPIMLSRPFTDEYAVKNYEISSSPKRTSKTQYQCTIFTECKLPQIR